MDDPLVRITALLERLKVPYCLIGGYAVAAHGVPRYTADVDLMVIPPQGDIAALAGLLQETGLKVEVTRADRSDPLGGVITILQEVPVQLLVAKYKYQLHTITNAQTITYENRHIKVARPEDLIILKLKAGEPKDLWDVENLLTACADLDMDYLSERARENRVDRRLKTVRKSQQK